MKKLFLLTVIAILFIGCQKSTVRETYIETEEQSFKAIDKVDVCHWDEELECWFAINIPEQAYYNAHINHGDILVVDNDGDGYYPFNECGINNPNGLYDCDDSDASINPEANEICEDGIDNNCDGLIDEDCVFAEYVNEEELQFFSRGTYTIYLEFDYSYLTEDGMIVYDHFNSGGSALYSYCLGMNILNELGYSLVKSEDEISYDTPGDIFCLSVNSGESNIGVEITRAFTFPAGQIYTQEQADALLESKLEDLSNAQSNVSASENITSSLLFIFADLQQYGDVLSLAWNALSDDVKSNITLYIVVTEGNDTFMY